MIFSGGAGEGDRTLVASLEDKLENAEEEPVLIHPEMGRYYREQVTALSEALGDEAYRTEAVAIIRTLVDKIVLTPAEIDGKKTVVIDLHGQLAGILSLASNAEKPLDENDFSVESIKLVAGARCQQESPMFRVAV